MEAVWDQVDHFIKSDPAVWSMNDFIAPCIRLEKRSWYKKLFVSLLSEADLVVFDGDFAVLVKVAEGDFKLFATDTKQGADLF